MNLVQDLSSIVGPDRVADDPDLLDKYSSDFSLVQPAAEVQRIVEYANQHGVPVTPRSSAVGFYGAGIPEQGGIVVDLSRMNRILEIDPRNKKVKVEPGEGRAGCYLATASG